MKRTPLRKVGKKGKLRAKMRRQWLKLNAPSHEGFYVCWICDHPVHQSEMALDHVLPSSKYPELMSDLDNLAPSHSLCNEEKGSRVY